MPMVMVPVPEEFVMDVYMFLSEKEEERRKEQDAGGKDVAVENQRLTDDELRDMLETATNAMSKILPYLADRPGQPVDRLVLARLVYGEDATTSQLNGAVSALTRRNLGRYGKAVWPFKPVPSEGPSRWAYVMDDEYAEKINSLRQKG